MTSSVAVASRNLSLVGVSRKSPQPRLRQSQLCETVNMVKASGSSRKDSAWKYTEEVEVGKGKKKGYVYVKCNFCNKVLTGGIKRAKDHLACTHKNVAPCPKVPEDVKQEMKQYLEKGTALRHMAQGRFEERVSAGSYFEDMNSNPTSVSGPSGGACVSSRGVRGPMERYIAKIDDDEDVDRAKTTMTSTNAKQARSRVCLDIGRFFFENAIPFNVARSPSFINMCRSIGSYGQGLKPPTMHELRTWILKDELDTSKKIVDNIKKTWAHTGVSILSDGWTDISGRTLINFLVNNPNGTVFLRCVDTSEHMKDADLLFKLLDGIVEEVGEELVVQVVTDNASNYKATERN
ncbi:uncharacterized protein LOC120005961 [Tripterygium wilfordii]|uniref:uncharacterized protein LOC120005961 n=1 Tax=Tripterygium wilfordii TaxID=458696 RepID=UPI0018F83C19|nr:uncharacterized protein LOC120005961 [Tripterygium wilfordii]